MRQKQLIAGCEHPRPNDYSDEVVAKAAAALLPRFLQWLGKDTQGDELNVLTELLDSTSDWDGFKLACDLDRDGYTGDSSLVDILDGADGERYEAREKLVAAWVQEYDIRPKLKVGDVVRYKDRECDVEGIVTKIDSVHAVYTVTCPSLGHIGHLSKEERGNRTGTIGFNVAFEKLETQTI